MWKVSKLYQEVYKIPNFLHYDAVLITLFMILIHHGIFHSNAADSKMRCSLVIVLKIPQSGQELFYPLNPPLRVMIMFIK